MRFRISHVTRYDYAEPVSLCHNIAHLKPCDTANQKTRSASVRVDPWPAVMREYKDYFGNRVSYFSIQQSHTSLEVNASSEVDVTAPSPLEPSRSPTWEDLLERLADPREAEARLFALPSSYIPLGEEPTDYARVSFPPGRPYLEGVTDLMGRIHGEFTYDPQVTTVATPLAEVLEHRRGVCQDFAHLAIACLRGLGFAARYVSGYLETLPPPGQPKLRGADASHAWFSVYLPGTGWVDFDPTNNQTIGQQHIVTGVGRDFQDVTPLRGVFYGGGEHQLQVAVDVDRLPEGEAEAA